MSAAAGKVPPTAAEEDLGLGAGRTRAAPAAARRPGHSDAVGGGHVGLRDPAVVQWPAFPPQLQRAKTPSADTGQGLGC